MKEYQISQRMEEERNREREEIVFRVSSGIINLLFFDEMNHKKSFPSQMRLTYSGSQMMMTMMIFTDEIKGSGFKGQIFRSSNDVDLHFAGLKNSKRLITQTDARGYFSLNVNSTADFHFLFSLLFFFSLMAMSPHHKKEKQREAEIKKCSFYTED